MRIRGEELTRCAAQPVTLERADGTSLTLRLAPLPLGFHRRLRRRGIVSPQPPSRVARDSQGRPLRDASGQATLMVDERDPAYRDQVEAYHQRVAVLAIAEALRGDADVEFAARPPAEGEGESQPGPWAAYADAVFEELEAAGFTASDVARLCEALCGMTRLLDAQVQEARAGFFSTPVRGSG